jgi:hypothetical protein
MKMSRWEQAQKIVGSVLNGRGNELAINIESDAKAEGFEIMSWTIHGGGPGLNVELALMDVKLLLEKGIELELANKINVGWTRTDIKSKYVSGDF